MTVLHLVSTLVLLLIAAGVYHRKRTRLHLMLMSAAFTLDVALVLYIELTRHAVEKTVNPAHHTGPLLWFHIIVSVGVLIAYVWQIQLGRRLLAGLVASRGLHLRLGVTFCALRLINYVTSFMIV
ncbi:MAG TPA: hypothetical protein VNO52_11975 [Methylomirabilota bacterium]|nr:hypothetical protein [Methylomirabilota bacterium]